MAHPLDLDGRKPRRFDLIAGAAVLFFALAALFAIYPALRAGPATAGGLLLLVGVAGVAIFAMLAMRGTGSREAEALGLGALLAALPEPSAVASSDGRIIEANAAWDDVVGLGARLPRSSRSGGLFTAISEAGKGRMGATALRLGDGEREAQVTRFGERRYLVRLTSFADKAAPAAAPEHHPTEAVLTPAAATSLDAFAAAAPFGAALLGGSDPLSATILEVNPAIRALAGGADPTGSNLAALIEPNSLRGRRRGSPRAAPGRSRCVWPMTPSASPTCT